jgi:hypothetical protein
MARASRRGGSSDEDVAIAKDAYTPQNARVHFTETYVRRRVFSADWMLRSAGP